MPGISEFVSMGLQKGGGSNRGDRGSKGATGAPAANSAGQPRRWVIYGAIVAAYVYNSALALAIIEFPMRGMTLPWGTGGNKAIEMLFWDRFVNFTALLIVSQLVIFAYTALWPATPPGFSATSESSHMLSPENMQLSIIFVGAIWGPGCTFFAALIAARRGIAYSIFLIITTQFQDTWQLVFGKLFGRNRPFPYLSPKKSVEGYVGGTIAIITQIWYFSDCCGHADCWEITAFFVVVFGIAGDLSMSAMKRWRKIKDTGSILPGVGGLLDRTDSLLLVLPLYYAFDVLQRY